MERPAWMEQELNILISSYEEILSTVFNPGYIKVQLWRLINFCFILINKFGIIYYDQNKN
jgi:hypothetical protein